MSRSAWYNGCGLAIPCSHLAEGAVITVTTTRDTSRELTEQEALRSLQRLMHENLDAARARADELVRLHPDWGEMRIAADIIAPPKVTVGKPGRYLDTRSSWRWIQEHADEYRGQWVALRGPELLGADPDRGRLHRVLEAEGRLEDSLFAFIPDYSAWADA